MFQRTFRVVVPANSTTVTLPVGIDRDAVLEVTNLTNPEHQSNTKRIADGSMTTAPQPYDRTLQIGVTQGSPLIATHGAVPDWVSQTEYFAGELVYWRKRIYRAKADVTRSNPQFGASAPHHSYWENATGDTGNIVFNVLPNLGETDGLWPCNGSMINAPWSPLHNTRAPNLGGRLLSVAGSDGSRTIPGPGAAPAQNTMLTRAQLPNVNITGVTSTDSAGVPNGTVSLGYSGDHQHTLMSCGSGTSSSFFDHNTSGSSYDAQYYSESVRPAGNHTHSASFSGSSMAGHAHTTSAALNPATQTALNYYPDSFALSAYIRL